MNCGDSLKNNDVAHGGGGGGGGGGGTFRQNFRRTELKVETDSYRVFSSNSYRVQRLSVNVSEM